MYKSNIHYYITAISTEDEIMFSTDVCRYTVITIRQPLTFSTTITTLQTKIKNYKLPKINYREQR